MQADTFSSHLRIINVNAPYIIGAEGKKERDTLPSLKNLNQNVQQ